MFRHVRMKKYNIACLQDVHIQSQQEAYVKAEWGYDAYFSSFNSSSRGVMILLNNSFEHKVEKVISGVNGNYLILDINIEGISFILVNIYGPNEDKPKFYSELRKKYKSRKENPQKPTQLSSRSHPRHLVGKRTAQKTPS